MSPVPAGPPVTPPPLIIPRRLAIALLAEAQRAEGGPVRGVIAARDGVPAALHRGEAAPEPGESVWARYRSEAGPEPTQDRELLISLDTKGVLQLRCREPGDGGVIERELRIV
jgi:[CysO sulfur-carrier protein]-S-L-cysteine hydrolase